MSVNELSKLTFFLETTNRTFRGATLCASAEFWKFKQQFRCVDVPVHDLFEILRHFFKATHSYFLTTSTKAQKFSLRIQELLELQIIASLINKYISTVFVFSELLSSGKVAKTRLLALQRGSVTVFTTNSFQTLERSKVPTVSSWTLWVTVLTHSSIRDKLRSFR